MECSRVQVERPSSSTSGGHSGGMELGEEVVGGVRGVVGVVFVLVELEGELSDLACLVRLRQAATEVHVRQLRRLLAFGIVVKSFAEGRTACRLCQGQRPWATGPWSRCPTLCARSLRGSG
jgi:hypothetical protein